MEYFNGGTTLLILLFFGIAGGFVYLKKNGMHIFTHDNSPLQKAKRDWCKAWNGTAEKQQAEREWDKLGIAEFKKATSLAELYNAHERVFDYCHHWKHKKRESKVLLWFHKRKKRQLKKELDEKERQEEALRAEQAQKTKGEGRRHAPHPKKLPGAGKNFHFHSGH